MKINIKPLKRTVNYLSLSLLIFLYGCERNISEDAVLGTYPRTAIVFDDNFVGMGTDFIKFYGGSNFQSFAIDRNEGYESNTSIRINVSNASNTNGNYAGGIFVIDGVGRDLTGYNALTCWVKASTGVSIDQLGFGEDFGENKYMASLVDVNVDTGWSKVIIPLPDPSKLTNERGMFRYAAGTRGTNGTAYTLWIDEIKFEKLGTITEPQGSIQLGTTFAINSFAGTINQVNFIETTSNMPDGTNVKVRTAPAYFNFTSSDTNVATVNSQGAIKSVGAGTAKITAQFKGAEVPGDVSVNCFGAYTSAPLPTRPQNKVISIFSNAYNNVPVSYYNGYWQPWQTSVSADFTVNDDDVLQYTIFNFVGIEFSNPTVNAGNMTHFHADFFFPQAIAPNRELRIILVDFGANGAFGGGDDTRHSTRFMAPILVSQNWVSIDIPFTSMPNLLSKTHLGQIILEGGDGTPIYVDNIYFYNN